MSERGASMIARVAGALLLCGAVGCQNELFSDSMTPHTASPERLREVGTFDPVKESAVPARSLAEASRDLAADRLPGQKPPRAEFLGRPRGVGGKRLLEFAQRFHRPAERLRRGDAFLRRRHLLER